MTSQTGQKIRLVKCPKCLKILQEDEDIPVYQCGGCSAILQAKRLNIVSNITPSAVETERAQASDPETNSLSMESMEKELDDLEISNEDKATENQKQECSFDDSEKNEEEDNSRLESHVMNTLAEAAESGTSSRSFSVHDLVATRASNSSDNASSLVKEKQSNLSFLANRSLQLEGPRGFLARQGRRYVTEQLRPNIPLYPREPYTGGLRPMKQHELQARQRQRVAKSHVCPIAGGAPFINCYSCSENLQLPLDFLIFKKKHHHLLRCSTCTTVLRFSLQSSTHLVPSVTNDINANRSDNSTSESPRDKDDEELPMARSSPLHRLMGYPTVSQVFKASQRRPSV